MIWRLGKAPVHSSKIVDDDGKPLVVYHGTNNDFTVFDLKKSGTNTNNKGIFGIGIFYFEKNKASRYGAYSQKIGGIPTGHVHNIASIGINVKPQTETLQFFKWFGQGKAMPVKIFSSKRFSSSRISNFCIIN